MNIYTTVYNALKSLYRFTAFNRFLAARRFASAVNAEALCLSVCLSAHSYVRL